MKKINYPVCCILGHVDVGKTKLLDKLRNTHIQLKEIGGITQQIGSTFFDKQILKELTKSVNGINLDISGLIMIDTPGHDCFSQMRMTGVKISHITIIVVDIIKGLEKQTVQCIELLKQNNSNFIIALNKIDKIYGWNSVNDNCLKKVFEKQTTQSMNLLKDYINKIVIQLAELELNGLPYYENKNAKEYVSMVPLSANTGEGIADLIMVISKMSNNNLLETTLFRQLEKYDYGFVLDIKRDDKFGIVYHCIFIKGKMSRGDEIIIECKNRSMKNIIKEIYVPYNQIEIKSKTHLLPTDDVFETKGIVVKFQNNELENIINIGGIFIINKNNNESEIENKMLEIAKNDTNISSYNFDKKGIIINVPSTSMANAVVQILKDRKDIKIMNINIGQINKSLITKVYNVLNKYDKSSVDHLYNKKYAVILDYNCSNNDNDPIYDMEIINFAKDHNVKIINANIIYKLFDEYKNYIDTIHNSIIQQYTNIGNNFELQIIPKYMFLKKSPLLFGVKIIKGTIKKDYYVEAILNDKIIILGKITGIQRNNKNIDEANYGDVCIKIEGDTSYEYGKDFNNEYKLKHYMNQNEKTIYEKYKDIFN